MAVGKRKCLKVTLDKSEVMVIGGEESFGI